MPKIDEAYVEIGTKMQKLTAGFRAAQRQGETWARGLGVRLTALANRGFAFVGQQLISLARKLKQLAFIGVAAFIAIEYKALKAGMALVEATNRFRVMLGKQERDARQWVQGFAKAVRLNESEIADYLARLHMMIKAQGIAEDQSLKMAQALTQRVLDLSSLMNIPIEEMFNKATSALMGMSRPMQNIGFVISETTAKEWALQQGLIKTGEEMTEQQKVMARYGRMMETTIVARGDLLRTLQSEANQVRQVRAAWIGFLEELGKKSMEGGGFAKLLSSIRFLLEQMVEPGGSHDELAEITGFQLSLE